MDQVSGLRFKLLYPRWYRNKGVDVAFPNGLLPHTADWMIDLLNHQTSNIEVDDIDRPISLRPFYDDTSYAYLFRHADFYRHFKITFGKHNIVDLNDVDDNDDTLYFYPIEIEGDRFRFLFTTHSYNNNGHPSDYHFNNSFNPRVLELIKLGKVKIVISFMVDPCEKLGFLDNLEKSLNEIGIESNNIIVLSGNVDHSYQGGMILIDSIISLYQTSHTIPLYPFVTSLGYESDYVRVEDLDKNKFRDKRFLSFNRNLNNGHRIALCYMALKHKLLDQSYFSFLTNLNADVEYMLSSILHPRELINLASAAKAIREFIPYELDTQHVENKLGFTTNENNKKEFYINSYFHITTETEFTEHRSPFFSEKTWRPILNLQPFIYLGNPYSLKKLHDLGFKTFEPWIDESYDNVADVRERFSLATKEILKIQSFSFEQLHEMYYQMTDILIHNQKTLKEKVDYDPISSLINYEFRK